MDEIPMSTDEISPDDNEQIIYSAMDALMDIVIFLVILVNLLMIFVIFTNKRLQTRTYWIFLNWAANDIFFLILIALREFIHLWLSGCVLVHVDFLFPLNCTLLMMMVISNTLINGNHSLKIILGVTYLSTFLLLTGFTFLCLSMKSLVPGFTTFMIISLILFIAVLVKECNKCRKMKATPLRAKTVFRLNLARIYIYNFIAVIFLYLLFEKLIESKVGAQSCMVSFLLAPIYEMIYLMAADKNFKIATLNVFKRASNRQSLDTETNITDDDDYVLPTNV